MLRLNSTVIALSPLGKRRGGESGAAIGLTIRSQCFSDSITGKTFARPFNVENACDFNKLIAQPPIRCDDRAGAYLLTGGSDATQALTSCPRLARCAPSIPPEFISRCP
jgi:hypothetical protein